MKITSPLILLGLICATAGLGARTFTNLEGQKIEAELVGMEDDTAILKLAGGKQARVPLSKLSQGDEAYARAWWEENKNKMSEWDVRMTIVRDVTWTKKPVTSVGKHGKSKMSEDETIFSCKAESFCKKTFSNLEAQFEIYKRVSTSDANGSITETEILDETVALGVLAPHGVVEFKSTGVKCVVSSNSPVNGEDSSRRETVYGMVVTLFVDGKEALRQGHPENFLQRLEEEEEREEERRAAEDEREGKKDDADAKREESNESEVSRREREDAEREKRRREEMEAIEKRKAEEREGREIK